MAASNADDILRTERDSICGVGILAHNYRRFDPSVNSVSGAGTHIHGANVHGFVVDNHDGEVLAIGRNRVDRDENPLQHAEQIVLRSAIDRVREKRPRPADMTVRDYYRKSMFMEAGNAPGDYLRKGCTLYNTFDPCAMCAVALLFCYMKRIVYVIPHPEFESVYDDIRARYFPGRESRKEGIVLGIISSPLIDRARQLFGDLDTKIKELVRQGVDPFRVVDHCRDEMARAADILGSTASADLITAGDDKVRDQQTLRNLQRLCNLPAT